ncbi:hypothetical protein EP1X_09000 [Thermococcus sp. EP1]|uniref:hypothetical protein n=1 Tax=Thermococcus sp. EP1 TaxID=1591054 RepID=UPI0006D97769|nr:hypothetical protein [Thermococcus sp. EP1]KPU62397.1 hypothetical protein EP1X_09000 [Thermococcus sp. EP1]
MVESDKIRKEYVCLKCGSIFDSIAKTPRCPVCKSRKVVESKFWIKTKQKIESELKTKQKLEFNMTNELVKPSEEGDLTRGKPSETTVKLMVKGENKVKKGDSPGEVEAVKGESVVVNNNDGFKLGEKPLVTGENEVVFSGSPKPPEGESKGETLKLRGSNGISISTFFIKIMVFLGIITLAYWKRKEIWNFINSLFGREEDQSTLSYY